MSASGEPIFEEMEQRLSLMSQLADALEQAQAAVLARDLNELGLQTGRQQELCAALCRLANRDSHETAKRHAGVGRVAAGRSGRWIVLPDGVISHQMRSRWEDLGRKLASLETQVEHLNRVHAGLLRRARRTLDIFSRALVSTALTYAAEPQTLTAQIYPRK
jgi:hypothetical protein